MQEICDLLSLNVLLSWKWLLQWLANHRISILKGAVMVVWMPFSMSSTWNKMQEQRLLVALQAVVLLATVEYVFMQKGPVEGVWSWALCYWVFAPADRMTSLQAAKGSRTRSDVWRLSTNIFQAAVLSVLSVFSDPSCNLNLSCEKAAQEGIGTFSMKSWFCELKCPYVVVIEAKEGGWSRGLTFGLQLVSLFSQIFSVVLSCHLAFLVVKPGSTSQQ